MGLIEARIGITDLGDSYRSLGFFPPLPRSLIDSIHNDEKERNYGLPYIRLKDTNTPDGLKYTEATIAWESINPDQNARNIASKIISIARVGTEPPEHSISQEIFVSSRQNYLFGMTAVLLAAQELSPESVDPLQPYETQAPLAA